MSAAKILGLGAAVALGMTVAANAAIIGTVSGDYSDIPSLGSDTPTIIIHNSTGSGWTDVRITDNQDAVIIDLGALAGGATANCSFGFGACTGGAFSFDPDDTGTANALTRYTVSITGPAGTSGPFGDAPVGNGNDWMGLINDNSTGGSGFLANITTTGTAVPEPATLTLLGTALIGLGALRRRRKV